MPYFRILGGRTARKLRSKTFMEGTSKERAGYNKIEFCRKQTVSDGLQHFWVDTCCIDKSSSAELTEAINSMFRWYQDASNCYVYLSDISTSGGSTNAQSSSTTWEAAFRQSIWFTRGWTLQELIAPASVEFFSQEGDRLGNKKSLEQEIHEITKIPVEALRGGPLTAFGIEERMSWANDRETKRQEDKAYSLLGIFNVRMWLDYGEGRERAFERLRKKIGKSSKQKRHQDIPHHDDQAIKDDNSMTREQKRQRRYDITDWISPIDFAAQQTDITSRRQEGTGVWLTDSPEFLGWLQGSNQTLFCPGIPGAGKTMIAAAAVDHLWTHVQDKDIGVAYIYCNYKTRADQKAANLAATILKQLIQGRPSVPEPVVNLYDRHADRGTRPSLEEILNALQAVVSSYSKVYVVVDALDECLNHDRSQLLAMLRNLQSKGHLSFMATSRFIPEVMQQFNLSPMLEVRASDSDVKLFIAGQMYLLPEFVQRDSQLQTAIQDGISTAVEGM
jgi:AAA domain/Heterokaryon incompatibility protein (HET)